MRLLCKDKLPLRTYTRGEGYYDESGDWVTASTFKSCTLICCIQPQLNSRRRAVTFRGVEVYDYITARTSQFLQTADEHTNQEADRVQINGNWYEVVECEQWWAARRLSHYEAVLVEIPKGLE
jgi:hypothetical protein